MDDLSSVGRSSSIIIGWRIFADYPLVGSGFNSFPLLERAYSVGLEFYNAEPVAHNLFSSYAQQMGVLGIFYSVLPLILILSNKEMKTAECAYLALFFAVLGSFAGDSLYMPLTWLVLALVTISPSGVPSVSPALLRDKRIEAPGELVFE
jgi:hypothetical protein